MFAFSGLRMRAGPEAWEPSFPPPRVGACLGQPHGARLQPRIHSNHGMGGLNTR
jgi:hypothetical protein